MYRLAVCLLATFCVGIIHAQSCQSNTFRGKVWFILDQSEVARGESTSANVVETIVKYDQMRNAIRDFAAGFRSTDDVQIGLVGYSAQAAESVGLTSPANLVTRLNNDAAQRFYQLIPDDIVTNGFSSSGGSFTDVGLEEFYNLALRPAVPGYQNVVVIVSASGSYNNNRRNAAVATARNIVSAGFTTVLYAVNAVENNIDSGEMAAIGLAVQQGSPGYTTLRSYTSLSASLVNNVRNPYLCVPATPDTTTTTTTTTTTRPAIILNPNHPCANCAHLSGLYIVPHPETCSKYMQCDGLTDDGAYNVLEFNCGTGTLFNETTAVCVKPEDYNCPAWGGQCRQGNGVRDYAHLCCGMYWRCDNGSVTETFCPAGQKFSQADQNCQPSNDQCLQSDLCMIYQDSPSSRSYPECASSANAMLPDVNECCWRYYNCTSGQSMNCPANQVFDSTNRQCSSAAGTTCVDEGKCGCHLTGVAGDPCAYTMGGFTMRCSEGTQFDQRGCNCLVPSDRTSLNVLCPKKVIDQQDGIGRVAGECKAGVHITFNTDFSVTDEILGAPKAMWINRNDVEISANSAVFRGNEGATGSVLFIPYFANRAFPVSFAMNLRVRFDTSANQEYVLLSNDRCNQCAPTLRLTASRGFAGSNQWTFTFWANGAKEASVSATVSIASSQWTTVEIKVIDGLLSGTVSPATSATSPLTATAGFTNDIGGLVQISDCGLSLGQGQSPTSNSLVALDGAIDDFKYYECEDMTTLV